MAGANDYNPKHWSKKLPQYLDQAWSKQPSPFAQFIEQYIPPNAALLELGTGAGQDGLWLAGRVKTAALTDAGSMAFDEIANRAHAQNIKNIEIKILDLTQPFEFSDNTFDMVYAQLVLHYFDDDMTQTIMSEIHRVLKPGGILACMMNSVNDPEYDPDQQDETGLIDVGGLRKRYFSPETFKPFITNFQTIVFDSEGRTPKDDAVENSGMVRFVGKKQ